MSSVKNYRKADKGVLVEQGKRLAQLMETLNLNQSQLAEVLQCKQPLISNVLKGDTPLSSQNKIILHKTFGLNILWYDETIGEMFVEKEKMETMQGETIYTPKISQKRFTRIMEAVRTVMEQQGYKTESEFCSDSGLYPNYLTEFMGNRLKDADKLIFDVLHKKFKVNLGYLFYDEDAMFIAQDNAKLANNAQDDIRVLTVVVDQDNNELTRSVPAYAQAGYLQGYRDPEFIETLPDDNFFYNEQNGSYRTFEIIGDSMEPHLEETDYVRGKFLDPIHWRSKLRIGEVFIVVHEDGIICKQLKEHNTQTGDITLRSFNDIYEDRIINLEDVYELWYFKGYFSRRSFRGV